MKFKLEPILKLRLNKEDIAKRNMALVARDLEMANSSLLDMENERANTVRIAKEMLNGGRCRGDLIAASRNINYLKTIDSSIRDIKTIIDDINIRLEEKRVLLYEAVKERKILEKLKEREMERLIAEENERQLKIMDELVSYKYASGGDRVVHE